MAGSKYSGEFKEQIVVEVIEKSRPVSEVAKAYGLVPQTAGSWVNK
ncbi:transposase, partial [Actinomyces trachealis]